MSDNLDDRTEPGMMSEPIRREEMMGTHRGFYDNGGLSDFHRVEQPEETSNSARLIGASVVVLMLIGAGVYAFTGSGGSPVPNNKLPQTAAVQPANPPAPPSSIQTAPVTPPAAPGSDALATSPYGAAPSSSTSSTKVASGTPDASVTDKSVAVDKDVHEPKHVKTAHHRRHKDEPAKVQQAQAQGGLNVTRTDRDSTPPSTTAEASAPASAPPSSTAANEPPAASGSTALNGTDSGSATANGSVAANMPSDNGAQPATALPAPSPPASSMASNGQPPASATMETQAQPAPATSAPAQPDQSQQQSQAPSSEQPQ